MTLKLWGKIVSIVLFFLVLTGCSLVPVKSFTLQTELPANFGFKAKAYYEPAPGETCELPPRRPGHIPGIKYFESPVQTEAHTSELTVPLTDREGGCPLALRHFSYRIEAKYGSHWSDSSRASAGLSFRDELPEGLPAFPESGMQTFEGECHWWFRTVGPYRRIIKLLNCRSTGVDGKLQKYTASGMLQSNQVVGKVVRFVFRETERQTPYYQSAWVETDKGWKPCTGRWGTPNEEFCLEVPRFTDFKLPDDDRRCTVYPNCTE